MEVELQYVFEGDEPHLVPVTLAGFALTESVASDLVETYYDTPDCTLRRSGCTLRIRRSHGHGPELVWKGPSQRRPDGAKEREEATIMAPERLVEAGELEELLVHTGYRTRVEQVCGGAVCDELQAVGELRTSRSSHFYAHGLHRLELSWDSVSYPLGPGETRLEVEAKSEHASRFLEQADTELRAIFGDALRPASAGKARELHERLYPELLAA